MYQRLFELAPSIKPLFEHVPAKRQSRKIVKMVDFIVKVRPRPRPRPGAFAFAVRTHGVT